MDRKVFELMGRAIEVVAVLKAVELALVAIAALIGYRLWRRK